MSFLKQKCLDLLSTAFEHKSSDAKRLFKLTKESWEFDRRRASLIILERIFHTGAGYVETRIDASLFTQSLRILQRDPTFRRSHYAKIVVIKLCLTAMNYKADRFISKVKIALDAMIQQNRMLRLVASYLQLPYSQQVKEGTQYRYNDLKYQVSNHLRSFEETVGAVCRATETCAILVVAGRDLLKDSLFSAFLLASFTLLHGVHAIYRLKQDPENELCGYQYRSERRISSLQNYTLQDPESAQDIKLYGSKDWLLANLKMAYEESSKQKPLRDLPSRVGYLYHWMGLLQRIGIPTMALVSGFDIDLDAYYYAIMSLGSVTRNLESLRWTADYFARFLLPYAREYQKFLEMADEAKAIEDENSGTIDGPVKSIEFQSVSFWYSNPEEEHEALQNLENISNNTESRIDDDNFTPTCIVSDEEHRDSYSPKIALNDFTFRFESGKVYSIIGKNGSGKTTLTKLLTKFYDPTQGSILVNDSNLSTISSSAWLQHLAVVPQFSSTIYSSTIFENIGIGMPALLDHDPKDVIREEAKDLGISGFISLDTFVGNGEYSENLPGAENEEWIDSLSGGQYQTVALARAFIRKQCSTVFILDEPSSNLDPRKEHDLFERLRKEKDGRITIFISHNLQTCRASDCILVMDKGCLVESGSHGDLVEKQNGFYAELYRLQNETWHEET